jgi:hypothetical protein
MAINIAELGAADRRAEDFEVTEPDFWLDDVDLRAEGDAGDAADPAFYDAKTDPGRPIDFIDPDAGDEPRYRPNRTREEALASFLETVRRVFGKADE